MTQSVALLLLHALPLDASMWLAQQAVLPGAIFAPTLYSCGDSLESWASGALQQTTSDRLIVVGCSIGGSCALEIAAVAPERVAALVLIGTKAEHRPDPHLHALALNILRDEGLEAAWTTFWEPLFFPDAAREVVAAAKRSALGLSLNDISRGVSAFHRRTSRGHVLSSFSGPIHFITGENDVAPGLKTIAGQAALAKHAHVHVIPDCGHYVIADITCRSSDQRH